MASVLPPFSLADMAGENRTFPTGSPALVCFVKEDCPTCNLIMPLLQAASDQGTCRCSRRDRLRRATAP